MRTGQVDVNGGRYNPLAPFGSNCVVSLKGLWDMSSRESCALGQAHSKR